MRPGHKRYGHVWLKSEPRHLRCPHNMDVRELGSGRLFPSWNCGECAQLFPELEIKKKGPWEIESGDPCPCGAFRKDLDMVDARVKLWLDGELGI